MQRDSILSRRHIHHLTPLLAIALAQYSSVPLLPESRIPFAYEALSTVFNLIDSYNGCDGALNMQFYNLLPVTIVDLVPIRVLLALDETRQHTIDELYDQCLQICQVRQWLRSVLQVLGFHVILRAEVPVAFQRVDVSVEAQHFVQYFLDRLRLRDISYENDANFARWNGYGPTWAHLCPYSDEYDEIPRVLCIMRAGTWHMHHVISGAHHSSLIHRARLIAFVFAAKLVAWRRRRIHMVLYASRDSFTIIDAIYHWANPSRLASMLAEDSAIVSEFLA